MVTRRRLIALAAALIVALGAVAAWRLMKKPAPARAKVAPLRPAEKPKASTGKVSIKGTLFDEDHGTPLPVVKVVLLGPAGEVSSVTGADGSFAFDVAPGRYRAFVRDREWITGGLQDRIRLDDGPKAAFAGVLDAHLAPAINATRDLDHLELTASRAAKVTGRVYDESGNPVVGAVVRMRQPPALGSFLRPVLGTDTAVTNESGQYTLLLPAGIYEIAMRHPKFAGAMGTAGPLKLDAGAVEDESLEAVKGCIVRGKVVGPDGKAPAPDGAIEVDNSGGTRFGPQARVGLDGTFEFATTTPGFYRLRAWPWQSMPSNSEEVDCENGTRVDHLTLKLADEPPDLDGTLVDAAGNPVPFTHIDLIPNDPNNNGQQERSDAAGRWGIFNELPGQYRLVAAAEGRGVVDLSVTSPKNEVELRLSGTGQIQGTTTQLVDGSIEVAYLQCGNQIDVPPELQIVPVHGGRFTIDGAPACSLRLHARWRNRTVEATVVVDPKSPASLTLDLGEPHEKTIAGTVRDDHGAPAAGVPVTALVDQHEAATVRTDRDGRFTLTTKSGAQLLARRGGKLGKGSVGKANVPREQVDIVLDTDAGEP